MKQLRRLTTATLQKAAKAKQANGADLTTYADVKTYRVIAHEINDSVYASIYGANINNMLRLSSPLMALESFLKGKNNEGPDNLSSYFILIGAKRFKITAVTNNWIDIEYYEADRAI